MPTLGNENDLFTLKRRKSRRQFASSESTFKLLLLLLLLLHSFNVAQVTQVKVFWMMHVDVVMNLTRLKEFNTDTNYHES